MPVILLVVLAMLGVQTTQVLAEKQLVISRITGWLLVIIGAFLLPAGIFNLRGWWIIARPINIYALGVGFGLLVLPVVVKLLKDD